MGTHIAARFEVSKWDETPFDDAPAVSKVTEALVEKTYSGDIDGTSTTKWLMAYAPDPTATYVGVERITGTIGGKRGSVVLLHDGAFERGVATGRPSCRVRNRRAVRRHGQRTVPRRPRGIGHARTGLNLVRYGGGKPPVATGPQRRGVMRMRHLP